MCALMWRVRYFEYDNVVVSLSKSGTDKDIDFDFDHGNFGAFGSKTV